MRKWSILLAILISATLFCACGTQSRQPAKADDAVMNQESELPEEDELSDEEQPLPTKEEMLLAASPMTTEEIEKSRDNLAYAKSLIGNTYTFVGSILSVDEDHAVILIGVMKDRYPYKVYGRGIVANLYLPTDVLVPLEAEQMFSFVGKLDDAHTIEEAFPGGGTTQVLEMEFKSAAIVSNRFERTGTLHSRNEDYGVNAWNVEFPGSVYMEVVHFTGDVSSYQGEEITYSCKLTSEGDVDAYILE